MHLFARRLAQHKFYKIQNTDTRTLLRREAEITDMLEDLERENDHGVQQMKGPFTTLKPKTSFTPSLTQYSNIDTFVNLVSSDLKQLKPNLQKRANNLTNKEKKAYENLIKRKVLILKPSDKGGNACIMSRPYYMNMISSLLCDTETYERLEGNPIVKYLDKLKGLFLGARENEILTEAEFKFIYNTAPTIATIYAIPKVHKSARPVPGRPIISGCDSLTQGASIYVDRILRPFVTSLPSYIQDTKRD